MTLSAAGATLQVSARKMVSAGYLAVWTPQETRARYPLLLAADSNSLDEQAEDETEEPMDEDNNDQAADPSTSPAAEKQVPAEALYGVLAAWKKDSEVNIEDVLSQERHTEPPRRFSEAMLVKEMESLGIGRPSTYGRIMDILVSRCCATNFHLCVYTHVFYLVCCFFVQHRKEVCNASSAVQCMKFSCLSGSM